MCLTHQNRRKEPRVRSVHLVAYAGKRLERLSTPISMSKTLDLSPSGVRLQVETGIEEGDLLVNKNLAKTLRRVAKGGVEEFYKGDTAKEIIRSWQAAGLAYRSGYAALLAPRSSAAAGIYEAGSRLAC